MKVDEENLRLKRAEEAARVAVTQEVKRYRDTMKDMGKESMLAPEDFKKAAEEYDDRVNMESTLKEQEAKAQLMERNMEKLDTGKKTLAEKEYAGDAGDSESEYSEYEHEGCGCYCTIS